MRNIMAQFTIMGLTKLVKNLKKLVYRSQTTQTQEMQNDLKIPPSFKVVYPPNWEEHQQLKGKAKTEYFNKWASKL
jgi:hypothetical protein